MGHRADVSFFDTKRPWSRRKDLILRYYLKPYLAKVSRLGRPICIIDGFAGPGRYGDGTPGSPLIIAEAIREMASRPVSVKLLCIEQDFDLFGRLRNNLASFEFSEARHSDFDAQIPSIEEIAGTHTLFLYLDPYTVEGIAWQSLDRLFVHLQQSRTSIELLLNFKAHSFARRGRAALRLSIPALDARTGDLATNDMGDEDATPILSLNRIAGGDWWQKILRAQHEFPSEVQQVTLEFCRKLRERFREVCEHSVKEHWRHTVPKYSLIFASRSDDALRLINDAAVRSREEWADAEMPREELLFESRPTDLVPDLSQVRLTVRELATKRQPRGDLIASVMRARFGEFSETQIRRCISELISCGAMVSATGKHRINDSVEVWRG
jgi:three-Cys-motif partner protein